MKTNLALLNSIGFTNPHQKCLYAAKMLKTATVSSPSVIVRQAVLAIPGRAAVIGRPAYPARAASAAVPASANTAGVAAGALYLNSPAFPPNTAIPPIPFKAATTEILSSPIVAAIPSVSAIISPAIVPIPGWENTITITATTANVAIEAFLPHAGSPGLFGVSADGVTSIAEMTPSALNIGVWLDTQASATPETIASEPATLEQYLYKYAVICSSAPPTPDHVEIINTNIMIGATNVPCKRIRLSMPAPNYEPTSSSLQLNKILGD